MRSRSRILSLTGAGLVAAVAATAGLAWACTPQASISLDPSTGKPGTRVVVTGDGFLADEPVYVYWEKAPTGRVLATARGPSFTVAVTIPQDARGATPIIAYNEDGDSGIPYEGRAMFTVADTEETTSGAGGTQPPVTSRTVGGAGDARSTGHAPAEQPESDPAAVPVAPAPADAESAPAETASRRGSGDETRSAARAPEGAAAGDLWAGFQGAPSLVPGLDSGQTERAPAPSLAAGLLLLAGGLVLALGGGLVAAARRGRRSEAIR